MSMTLFGLFPKCSTTMRTPCCPGRRTLREQLQSKLARGGWSSLPWLCRNGMDGPLLHLLNLLSMVSSSSATCKLCCSSVQPWNPWPLQGLSRRTFLTDMPLPLQRTCTDRSMLADVMVHSTQLLTTTLFRDHVGPSTFAYSFVSARLGEPTTKISEIVWWLTPLGSA